MWSRAQQRKNQFRDQSRSPLRRREKQMGVGKASPDECSAPRAFQAVNLSQKKPQLQTMFTQPALCQAFYDQKDGQALDPTCAFCLARVQNLDKECPCSLNSSSTCEYAKCLTESKTKCPLTYQNFFNTKRKPFEYQDLKNCWESPLKDSVENYDKKENPSMAWLILVPVFFLAGVHFLRKSRMQANFTKWELNAMSTNNPHFTHFFNSAMSVALIFFAMALGVIFYVKK
jgi:hypothetical protein